MATPSVLISGLGLMGGSLAAALSAAGWRVLLHHHRPGVAQVAHANGWGQAVASFADAADVDRFLERLHDLGGTVDATGDRHSYRADWPVAVVLGAAVLEIGRRRLMKREDDEYAGDGIPPGSRLAGWPGSWTARIP